MKPQTGVLHLKSEFWSKATDDRLYLFVNINLIIIFKETSVHIFRIISIKNTKDTEEIEDESRVWSLDTEFCPPSRRESWTYPGSYPQLQPDGLMNIPDPGFLPETNGETYQQCGCAL